MFCTYARPSFDALYPVRCGPIQLRYALHG